MILNKSQEENYVHAEITEKIIGAFYTVYNTPGYGFLEKVYENALLIELNKPGVKVVAQSPIKVQHEGEQVGVYFADLLVNDCVIIEIKTSENIAPEHEAQILNYLRATEIEVGLIANFGKTAQFKKKIFSNKFKRGLLKNQSFES